MLYFIPLIGLNQQVLKIHKGFFLTQTTRYWRHLHPPQEKSCKNSAVHQNKRALLHTLPYLLTPTP